MSDNVGGRKNDQGKPMWELLPYDALAPIVAVLTLGAAKYEPRNWERGLAHSRTFGACMRHLAAWWGGEDLDKESGLPHLAHAACEILFTLAFFQRGRKDVDDRPVAVIITGGPK